MSVLAPHRLWGDSSQPRMKILAYLLPHLGLRYDPNNPYYRVPGFQVAPYTVQVCSYWKGGKGPDSSPRTPAPALLTPQTEAAAPNPVGSRDSQGLWECCSPPATWGQPGSSPSCSEQMGPARVARVSHALDSGGMHGRKSKAGLGPELNAQPRTPGWKQVT